MPCESTCVFSLMALAAMCYVSRKARRDTHSTTVQSESPPASLARATRKTLSEARNPVPTPPPPPRHDAPSRPRRHSVAGVSREQILDVLRGWETRRQAKAEEESSGRGRRYSAPTLPLSRCGAHERRIERTPSVWNWGEKAEEMLRRVAEMEESSDEESEWSTGEEEKETSCPAVSNEHGGVLKERKVVGQQQQQHNRTVVSMELVKVEDRLLCSDRAVRASLRARYKQLHDDDDEEEEENAW